MTEAGIVDGCIIVAMGFDGNQGFCIPHRNSGVMAAGQEVPAAHMHTEMLSHGRVLC